MTRIDHAAWMQQPRMLAERCRGLPLIWTPDVTWFNNDWLGPVPHVHDDATEIGFLAQGSLEIQIGGSKRVYSTGDFVLMPPGKFHNYWFKGDETVCFFVAVAPNHKHSRLRTKNFTPDAYEGDAPYANVHTSDALPSNEHFQSTKVALPAGAADQPCMFDKNDRILYVVSGTAHVRVNTLSGTLAANQYQHIPATTPHQISNPGYEPLIVISMVITDPFTAHSTVLQEDD
jgi:quercetin dioxygenase-like cupin family protein